MLVLTNFPEPRSEDEHRLLERGLVVDVIAKSAVQQHPGLLPDLLDRHLGRLSPGSNDTGAAGPEDLREAA